MAVWCFPERKTDSTENTPTCRGNWGCDQKTQTDVAWTCEKKERCRLLYVKACTSGTRLVVEGTALSAGRGRTGRTEVFKILNGYENIDSNIFLKLRKVK